MRYWNQSRPLWPLWGFRCTSDMEVEVMQMKTIFCTMMRKKYHILSWSQQVCFINLCLSWPLRVRYDLNMQHTKHLWQAGWQTKMYQHIWIKSVGSNADVVMWVQNCRSKGTNEVEVCPSVPTREKRSTFVWLSTEPTREGWAVAHLFEEKGVFAEMQNNIASTRWMYFLVWESACEVNWKKINRWSEQFDQFYKVLYKSFALYPSNMPQIFWEHVLILVLK